VHCLQVEDPRLDCAILRPMESDGDHFLAYYLTKDDESAIEFKRSRFEHAPYEAPEDQNPTSFHFVRDYETVKVEQEVPNEFLLVLDDGETEADIDTVLDGNEREPKRRVKGAYYKNIERKMILKKKRVNAHEAYQDKWEIIKVTHVPMSKDEEDEREEALAEVMDPMFLLPAAGDADADGEAEAEAESVNGEGGEAGGISVDGHGAEVDVM